MDQIPRRKADSNHTFNTAPNLLDRACTAGQPNQKCPRMACRKTIARQPAGDTSYIRTREGWRPPGTSDQWRHHGDPGGEDGHCPANTAPGLQLPQRSRLSRRFAFAIGLDPMAPSMAHCQKILREHGFKVLMSGKGNCDDTAAVLRRANSPLDCFLILLTFFKTSKAELIWRRSWETRRQAETAISQYINGFNNPRRRHSALGWKSPLAFERKLA